MSLDGCKVTNGLGVDLCGTIIPTKGKVHAANRFTPRHVLMPFMSLEKPANYALKSTASRIDYTLDTPIKSRIL